MTRPEPRPAPRVTVCIRSVDRPGELREAVASVLAQTEPDLELIISFDGPLPEPAALRLDVDDPRIRLTRNPGPPDATANLAHALSLAAGEFVAILDDDDRWQPGFLAAMLAPFDARRDDAAGPLGVVFGDYALVAAAQALPRLWPWASGDQPSMLVPLLDRSIPPSAALIRRAALLDGETLLPLAPGLAGAATIWLRAAVQGWRFHHVPGVRVEYRMHPGQMSWAAETTASRYAATLERLDFSADPVAERARRSRLAEAHFTQAGVQLRRRRVGAARAAVAHGRRHGRLRTRRNLIAASGVRRLAARWLPSHPRAMAIGARVWARLRPPVA